MKRYLKVRKVSVWLVICLWTGIAVASDVVSVARISDWFDRFAAGDTEHYTNAIPNARAVADFGDKIPRFECPDVDIERTYYFRWWTFRKHLRREGSRWAVSEFLPNVHWAGKGNTISCPFGHHLREGRWLRDASYIDSYTDLMLNEGTINGPRAYACWPAWGSLERAKVTGDFAYVTDRLAAFVRNYECWEKGWIVHGLSLQDVKTTDNYKGPSIRTGFRADRGLFDYAGDREGSEFALSADGARPMINAAMWAEATAIAEIARRAGDADLAARYAEKSESLRENICQRLWNEKQGFFCSLTVDGRLDDVRELHGYAPFYFGLPLVGRDYTASWRALVDAKKGFLAPRGLTFPAQDTTGFALVKDWRHHECLWNGPSWPYATSVALTGLYASLQGAVAADMPIGSEDFARLVRQYAQQHVRVREDGTTVPWIDENVDPFTNVWLARELILAKSRETGRPVRPVERGKDYNHSTFCDLVIAGLCGIVPQSEGLPALRPLAPAGWDWWCVDGVRYHGHDLTVLFDRDGTRYGRGKGLVLLVDGEPRAFPVATPGQKVFRAGDRVVWIGDSITSCAHRLPHGYITTIEKAAKETGTPGFDNIIGLGYGGWHVFSWHAYERRSLKEPGLDSRFSRVPTLGDVFTNRLDVIVLALGINDHGFPTFAADDLAPWEAEYDRFISDLRDRCHPRQFILCNATTHTADPDAAANRRLERMNERIAALAKRHGALLVDFRTPAWRAIERVRTMRTGLRDLEDLIHPKEIGHAEMAREFCRTVGEAEMVRWLDGEVERRYAALAAKLGPEPRLVCALRPDRTENRPGVQRLAYDIPWNLVGADMAKISVVLPTGWRVIEKTLSPSNGLLRVFGHPTHLVNPVTVTARIHDRTLTETVPIPAPWLVSHDFPFPDAWKGTAWQTNAVPPVAFADVTDWSLVMPTWDYAGDVDPGALDLRSVNTGYPRGAAYVRRQLHAPRAMTLKLVLGTTFWSARNGIRIWCDGKPLAETQLTSGWEKGKPFACKDRAFTLELSPGWHDLVLLTANREFDHYFHCKILDAATGNIPDDLRIACTPDPAVARTDATPFKYLFFDDQRLYARTNLRRELGHPQAVAAYQDPLYDSPLPPAAVFACPDGKYRMLYQVYVTRKALNRGNTVGGNPEEVPTRRRAALALAVSDDGLSFRPDTPHIVSDAWGELGSSDAGDLGEVAFVIEDAKASAGERYKLFGCTNEMEFRSGRGNFVMSSDDLVNWTKIEDAQWHNVGTEPITSCFWNEAQKSYTVLLRPQAGERRVGWSLTKDFRTFTKPQFCLQCDPEDEPLAELYGAVGFAYDGWQLAMPLLFGGQPSEMRGKGRMGTMTPQLAYSMNGLNFQRVFHRAFIEGGDPSLVKLTGTKCPMVWPGAVRRDADGSVLLYTVCCGFDHGGFYRANRNTWIVAWRLREDGFVRLVSEDSTKESVLGTRDTLWRGGELRVNLSCRDKATVAIFASSKPGGLLAPVPGYGHADCEPFTGDSTAWTPIWRGGSLKAFKGRRIAFELRFRDGEVYSLAGNMTPMMWVQVQQYEEACVDPMRLGW